VQDDCIFHHTALDDETGEHLKYMVKSWPVGLEEKLYQS